MASPIVICAPGLGAQPAYRLSGFPERLRGLLGLRDARGAPMVLIDRCRSVHTFGMRFAIDLCFIDGRGVALLCPRDVGPGHLITCMGAASVIERPSRRGPWVEVGARVLLGEDPKRREPQ